MFFLRTTKKAISITRCLLLIHHKHAWVLSLEHNTLSSSYGVWMEGENEKERMTDEFSLNGSDSETGWALSRWMGMLFSYFFQPLLDKVKVSGENVFGTFALASQCQHTAGPWRMKRSTLCLHKETQRSVARPSHRFLEPYCLLVGDPWCINLSPFSFPSILFSGKLHLNLFCLLSSFLSWVCWGRTSLPVITESFKQEKMEEKNK